MGESHSPIRSAFLQQRGNGRLDPEMEILSRELSRRGIPWTLFVEKDLQRRRMALRHDILVAGHIPVVMQALHQLEVNAPVANDYPTCLWPWLRRRVWQSTVKSVVAQLQEERGLPFFVKPMGRRKRFPGRVVESWGDLTVLAGAADATPVLCSEVVRWLSEFRAFVVHGSIVGVRHYAGDPAQIPEQTVIEEAVACFEASGEAMAGYAADFGVLESGATALIEINDGFALGAYGLDDAAYTNLIVARWCELMERPASPLT